MSLHDQITDILAAAVENRECAGISILVRRHGEEVLYTQAGMADIAQGRLVQRDSIFRLYSQSKPVTAAAVMLLVERGLIDLMDGVDKYLPGFRNPQVVDAQGKLTPAYRAPWIMELLGMTAGCPTPGKTRRASTPPVCLRTPIRSSARAAASPPWPSQTAWGSSPWPSSLAPTGAIPPARTCWAR